MESGSEEEYNELLFASRAAHILEFLSTTFVKELEMESGMIAAHILSTTFVKELEMESGSEEEYSGSDEEYNELFLLEDLQFFACMEQYMKGLAQWLERMPIWPGVFIRP